MSARVEATDVKAIFDTTMEDAELIPFIEVAHLMVENILGEEDLEEGLLKEIERWASAHYASIKDPVKTQEKIGDASATYAIASPKAGGTGLSATPYGMQAIAMDPTGKLGAQGKLKASFEVLRNET